MTPIINFNKFYFRYKNNQEYALKDISLSIEANKFILLCGETGSGKTTLLRCFNGLIPQFYAGYYKGNVEINGMDSSEIQIADLSTEIGIVFQNPENQLIAMNVEHEIAFGLENIGKSPEEIRNKINEVVELTEISHLLDKAPFELSGGEQQRVAIASILALEPKILVLDEPTALLDPYMAKKIINLLKKIQTEKKITIIISEHRLDLVLQHADQLLLMQNGVVVEYDSKETVINGENFKSINLNLPVIYSIFNDLKKEINYDGKIPASISEAIDILQSYKGV